MDICDILSKGHLCEGFDDWVVEAVCPRGWSKTRAVIGLNKGSGLRQYPQMIQMFRDSKQMASI